MHSDRNPSSRYYSWMHLHLIVFNNICHKKPTYSCETGFCGEHCLTWLECSVLGSKKTDPGCYAQLPARYLALASPYSKCRQAPREVLSWKPPCWPITCEIINLLSTLHTHPHCGNHSRVYPNLLYSGPARLRAFPGTNLACPHKFNS